MTNPFIDALPELDDLLKVILKEVSSAAGQPGHAWFLAVLGSLSQRGPEQRTLVLREFDADAATLIWHTDVRSPKFSQLGADDRTSVLFWNAEQRVQLSIRGSSTVHSTGKSVDAHWRGSQLTSRRTYLGESSPGTPAEGMALNFPLDYIHRPPTDDESQLGRKNFGLIVTKIHEMDLLILRQSGNVRASFECLDDAESGVTWRTAWLRP